MAFFIVTTTHPDGDGWGRHVGGHVRYLQALVRTGELRASGSFKGTPKRAGFLIFEATSRAQIDALVANDPFAIEALIETLTVDEWDPLFGAFADASSGALPSIGSVD